MKERASGKFARQRQPKNRYDLIYNRDCATRFLGLGPARFEYVERLFCFYFSSEWGMSSIQNVFRRVNLPLSATHNMRLQLLQIITHLFNFRVRTTGISQIGTLYDEYVGYLRDTNP